MWHHRRQRSFRSVRMKPATNAVSFSTEADLIALWLQSEIGGDARCTL
jgi:hypothetical protein